MARIPEKTQLGPLGQLAARPRFSPAQDFTGEALANAGRSLQGVGGDFLAFSAARAKDDAFAQEQAQGWDADLGWAKFAEGEEAASKDAVIGAAPGAAGLSDAWGKGFDQRAQAFRQTLPERLRPQFEARIVQLKGNAYSRVNGFEVNERSRLENVKLDDAIDGEIRSVALNPNDPAALSAARQRAMDWIDKSPFATQIEKDTRRRTLDDKFAVGIGNAVNADPAANAKVFVPREGAPGQGHREIAASILRKEEGFRETPYWDVNALRTGFGSDTITKADGSVVKVAQGMTVTREDAERDLSRRIVEFENRAVQQVGDAWNALPAAAKGALLSVTYNYGSLPGTVVTAVKSGSVGAIAQAVSALSANKGRRQSEAAIINGGAVPENAPTFQQAQEYWVQQMPDASTETIQKLAEQSINARNGFLKQEAAQRTALAGQAYDSFQLRIATDDVSLTAGDILTSRDIDEGQKASLITSLESARKKQDEALQAVRLFSSGEGQLNPFDDNVQKAADAAYTTMVDSLPPEQKPFVAGQIIARGVIPKPVANEIRAGVYTQDPETFARVMDTAGAVKTAAPIAFDNMPDSKKIQDSLTSFQHYVNDVGLSATEAAQKLIARNKPEWQTNEKVLGPAADKAVKDIEVSDVTGAFSPGLFRTPGAGADASTENQLLTEYREAFRDRFIETGGDEDEAAALAKSDLSKTWGISEVSGSSQLMKYPPEKLYPARDGGYGYLRSDMEKTAKEIAGGDVSNVWLRPFAGTAADVRAKDKSKPPRYRLFYEREVDGQKVIDEAPGAWSITADQIAAGERADMDAAQAQRDLVVEGLEQNESMGIRDFLSQEPEDEAPAPTLEPQPSTAQAGRAGRYNRPARAEPEGQPEEEWVDPAKLARGAGVLRSTDEASIPSRAGAR